MSGQPDVPQIEARSYALEGLRTAQGDITQLTQALVIWRGKVESYRSQDLAAARDAYDILADTRKQLAEALGGAQLLLLEAEEYPMAAQAGQLKEIHHIFADYFGTSFCQTDVVGVGSFG